LAALSVLSDRHPEAPVDLVWLEEPYDRSVHYDALIHFPGEGTVSLSFARDQDLPWPLRGVQRWHDRDLARVNDVVLTIEHAIAQLDFVWNQAPIVRRMVDACLIRETLQREPIDVTEDDLQEALNAFRRARGLSAAEDTHRWLADKGLSSEKLEQLLSDQATLRKLHARVAEGRVEAYFEAHREELGEVALLRLDFPDQADAQTALDEARSEAFLTVAQRAIGDALARGQAVPVLDSVVVRGGGASPLGTFAASERNTVDGLRVAQPGEVLGPVTSTRGAALLQVLALRPACLDERTRQSIVHLLFEEWLADLRQAARIEWYWGNADQVTGV
jgi:putative peptide maturation system protein